MMTSVQWRKGCGLKAKDSPLSPKPEGKGFTGHSIEVWGWFCLAMGLLLGGYSLPPWPRT